MVYLHKSIWSKSNRVNTVKCKVKWVLFVQLCPTPCNPMDCSPPGSSPRNSPGKNNGVGSHFLLQGIFPSQGLNSRFLHCRQILSHQGIKSLAPYAAAAAKSLQSCLTLCDPIDGSPPGSAVPGILQARTLEWVAISFSSAWKGRVKVKSLSRVRLFATLWTAAYQAPLSMGFSRQEYWSGVPLPSLHHHLIDALKFILSNDVVLRGFMLLCLLYVLSPGRLKPRGLTRFWCNWLSKNTPWVTFHCIIVGSSYQLFIYHSVMLSLFLNFGVACLVSPFYTALSLVQ